MPKKRSKVQKLRFQVAFLLMQILLCFTINVASRIKLVPSRPVLIVKSFMVLDFLLIFSLLIIKAKITLRHSTKLGSSAIKIMTWLSL